MLGSYCSGTRAQVRAACKLKEDLTLHTKRREFHTYDTEIPICSIELVDIFASKIYLCRYFWYQ